MQLLQCEVMDTALEINQLHEEICGELKMTIAKAIRIGELLTKQKTICGHGNWLPWVAANLKFSQQSVDRYVKAFKRQGKFLPGGNLGLKEFIGEVAGPNSQEDAMNEPKPSKSSLIGKIYSVMSDGVWRTLRELTRYRRRDVSKIFVPAQRLGRVGLFPSRILPYGPCKPSRNAPDPQGVLSAFLDAPSVTQLRILRQISERILDPEEPNPSENSVWHPDLVPSPESQHLLSPRNRHELGPPHLWDHASAARRRAVRLPAWNRLRFLCSKQCFAVFEDWVGSGRRRRRRTLPSPERDHDARGNQHKHQDNQDDRASPVRTFYWPAEDARAPGRYELVKNVGRQDGFEAGTMDVARLSGLSRPW